MNDASTVIEMQKIQKSFGSRKVLRNVTGSIERGKTVGLLGRNGEGKTTLFRILLDIIAADAGFANILGHQPDGSGRIRMSIGYVPERPAFHLFHSVEDVFRFRRRLFPKWDVAKETLLIKQMELDPLSTISAASKGTLAKTAWICATAHHPEVLFLDEPTSGLDSLVRDAVLAQCVGELSSEGKTILVASHRMEEMMNVLDEVWVLADGEIKGRHLIHSLREGAIRISGRLRPGTMNPQLPIMEEFRSGDFVRWLTLDPEVLIQIRSMSLLDQIETEPLPLESALKLLLTDKENSNAESGYQS